MKLIYCSGFPEIYAKLEMDGEVSMPLVQVHSAIYMKLIWCRGFSEMYTLLQEDRGVSLPWVHMYSTIYKTYLV